jgi:hypothetical protein
VRRNHDYERVFENGKFLGFICEKSIAGCKGWWAQIPGKAEWNAPGYRCTRDEILAYLREQTG